jgi:hypothetical protein
MRFRTIFLLFSALILCAPASWGASCPSSSPYLCSDNYCYNVPCSQVNTGGSSCPSSSPYLCSDNYCYNVPCSQVNNGGTKSQFDCIFGWAERNYSMYFKPAAISTTTGSYYYRYYSGTGNYLAISSTDNHVWVQGPSFGNSAVDVGSVTSFLGTSGCH